MTRALRILRLRLALPLLFRRARLDELLARLDVGGPPHPDPLPPRSGERGGEPRREADALVPVFDRLLRPLRFWPTTCLWRSLAGYAALRAAGDDVRFLIGVRAGAGGALEGHAWLERGGRPSLGAPPDALGYRVAFAWPADPANLGRARGVSGEGRRSAARTTGAHDVGLTASEDALLTELADGTGVVLHLGTKFYYTLNRTGVLCWKRIAAGEATDAAALAASVARQHEGVDPAAIRRDVDALVADLVAERLVADGGAPHPEPAARKKA